MNITDIKTYIPDDIIYLAKILASAGNQMYLVGGCVRDMYLGALSMAHQDIDICGDASPDIFASLISNDKKIKLYDANFPLGTLKLKINNLDIEYTCFRKESYRGDGHHIPSKIVFTKNLEIDAKRRDFTINAIYLDPLNLHIYDLFEGLKDISNKIIRTIRNSQDVFSEDALRLLRMCRFAGRLGFNIDDDTLKGAILCAPLLANISAERIGAELNKILCSDKYCAYGIKALYKSKINAIICSPIKMHTAILVSTFPNYRALRWAAFLSDQSSEYAYSYIINVSLGKSLAKDVSHIIINKNIVSRKESEIIIAFAKMGKDNAMQQVYFAKTVSNKDFTYLKQIYATMCQKNQFISNKDVKLNGNDIKQILSVEGKKIENYKNKLYEYVVFNPDKNNYVDLKVFLNNV